MNNKTETPEEILGKKCGMTFDEDTYRIQTKLEYIISAMQEFSSQQNKELIEELETERKLGLKLNSDYTDLNTRLSAELSQQKELVEKKDATIEGYKNNTAHLYDQISTLKQEIEGLKKEREWAGFKNPHHLGCINNLETMESQSLRIKELEEYEAKWNDLNVVCEEYKQMVEKLIDGIKEIDRLENDNLITDLQALKAISNICKSLLSTPTTEHKEEKVLYTKSATVNSGDSINEEIFISKEVKEDKCKCEKWQGVNLSGNCYTCQKPI